MTIPMDDFLKLQQRVEKLEKRQQDIKMTDEGYTFLPLYDAEVDEDKMQKIINLLNKLGIKDFVRFARKEIHFLNLTDLQVEKLLEAQLNEYKDDFGLVGVRKHSNQPLHYYLQLKR